MIFVLAGLALSALFLIMPVVALVRLTILQRRLDELARRFEALERARGGRQEAGGGTQEVGGGAPESPPASRRPPPPPPAARVPPPAQPAPGLPPPAPGLPPPAPGPPPPAPASTGLEEQIGSRWMLVLGAAVLVLGIGMFVKYAFEHQWITETMRVALGAIAGIGLVTAGLRLSRAGYSLYGQIIAGGGFAALYLSAYAAANFYHLIPPGAAFLVMFAISAAAGSAAWAERSLGLAIMAVAGGFLTPFVIGSERGTQASLFTYDAILVALTAALARRREWPQLNVLSCVFTAMTVASWLGTRYRSDQYLQTELFLTIFCALFLEILRQNIRTPHPIAPRVTWVLASTPLLYHAASLHVLAPHSLALLVYLIGVTAAGTMAGIRLDSPGLRLATFVLVALPLFSWIQTHTARTWVVGASASALAIYGMHALAQLARLSPSRWLEASPTTWLGTDRHLARLASWDVALVHLNGLWLFGVLYLICDRNWPLATGALAFALAVMNAGMAVAVRGRSVDAAYQWLGLAFALTAFAIVLLFNGLWVTAGWAAEGAAVVWIGLRTRRDWLRAGGAALFAIAVVGLLERLPDTPAVFTPAANARFLVGAFIVGLLYALAVACRREASAGQESFLVGAANVLTVALLTAEIRSYWAAQADWARAQLARGAMISVVWGVYALAAVTIGIRRDYPPLRYFAIALFGVTIAKTLLVDMSELAGMYRIGGFVTVGAILLAASWLYQRRRFTQPGPSPEPRGPIVSP